MKIFKKLLTGSLSVAIILSCIASTLGVIANAVELSDVYSNGTFFDDYEGTGYNASDYWEQVGLAPAQGSTYYTNYESAQTVATAADSSNNQLKVIGYGVNSEVQGSLRFSLVTPKFWPSEKTVTNVSGKLTLGSSSVDWGTVTILAYYYKDQYNWRGFAICKSAVRHVVSFSEKITTEGSDYGKTKVYVKNDASNQTFITAGDETKPFSYNIAYAADGKSVTLSLKQGETVCSNGFKVSNQLGAEAYKWYFAEDTYTGTLQTATSFNPQDSIININTLLLNKTNKIALGQGRINTSALFDDTKVEFEKSAEDFRNIYSSILAKTTETIVSDDLTEVETALNTYSNLTDDVKSELTTEYNKLVSFIGVLKYGAITTQKSFKLDFESNEQMDTLAGTSATSIVDNSTVNTVGNSSAKSFFSGSIANTVSPSNALWNLADSKNLNLKSVSGKAYLNPGKSNQLVIYYYYKDSSNNASFALYSVADKGYTGRFYNSLNTNPNDPVNFPAAGGGNIPGVLIDNYDQSVGGKWINFVLVYNADNTVTINFYTEGSQLFSITSPSITAATEPQYNSEKVAFVASGSGGSAGNLYLDDINICFDDNASDQFKAENYNVFNLSVNRVAISDKEAIIAALAKYDTLSQVSKSQLTSEKAKLDSLKVVADKWDTTSDETTAQSFKTIFAGAIDGSVTCDDMVAAYGIYNSLNGSVKALLIPEKNAILSAIIASDSSSQITSDNVIEVACVGGPVTYGQGLDATEAYPAKLQTLFDSDELSSKFRVTKYANNYVNTVNSYTVESDYSSNLEVKDFNLWYGSHFSESDIIIVMTGEREYSSLSSQANIDKYKTVLSNVLKSYINLKNSPAVILVSNSITRDNNSKMIEMIKAQRELAAELGISFIDFGAVSQAWTTPTGYFQESGDAYKLNANGCAALAQTIYDYLKYFVGDCTLPANEVMRSTNKSTLVDLTVCNLIAKYRDVLTNPTPANVDSINSINNTYNLSIPSVKSAMETYVNTMNSRFTSYLPEMKGATVTLTSTKYTEGTLSFHTGINTASIPSGYSIVEYGTVIMRNAIIGANDQLIIGYSNGTQTATTARKQSLSITTDSETNEYYAYLKCNDTTNFNGYRGTNYAARSYLVYQDSEGKNYTVYSSTTIVKKSDDIARKIAADLIAANSGSVNYGTLSSSEQSAIANSADKTTAIDKIWTFLNNNKSLITIA